jgi:hypothetical protein
MKIARRRVTRITHGAMRREVMLWCIDPLAREMAWPAAGK